MSGSDASSGPARSPVECRCIVLIGFMGSGKSSVGEYVAERLGWTFIDTDRRVEQQLGLGIPEIFRDLGEPAFRRAERLVVQEALGGQDVVVSTGGGWAAEAGSIEAVPDDALIVWLKVTPEEVFRRLGTGAGRPLLDRPDALEFATDLLMSRLTRYALAHRHYDTTTASVEEIALQICDAVRSNPRSPVTETADSADTSEKAG